MSSKSSRVFLITGASTGIGEATARQAVEAGLSVVLAARSKDKLDALAADLGEERALAVECDVCDWEAQRRLVDAARDRFGGIDVVLANAGGTWGSGFVDGEDTPDEWRQMVLTNVYGVAATARLTLPDLIERKGHLLLLGSVAGRVPTGSLYSATKYAVTGMGESLRKSLVGTGVRVTLIEPGIVTTPFWDGMGQPDSPAVEPDDIARAILYAVSQPPHVDVNELLIRPTGQEI